MHLIQCTTCICHQLCTIIQKRTKFCSIKVIINIGNYWDISGSSPTLICAISEKNLLQINETTSSKNRVPLLLTLMLRLHSLYVSSAWEVKCSLRFWIENQAADITGHFGRFPLQRRRCFGWLSAFYQLIAWTHLVTTQRIPSWKWIAALSIGCWLGLMKSSHLWCSASNRRWAKATSLGYGAVHYRKPLAGSQQHTITSASKTKTK